MKPVHVPVEDPGRAGPPLSDEAIETSELVLRLVHALRAPHAIPASAVGARAIGRAEGPDRLSPHAVRAAIHLYQHHDRTIGQLAAGLRVSLGWASRIVSELDAAGMVARTDDPADRRVVHVTLTPEAISVAEAGYRWRGDAIERALGRLDADGRRAVQTFLRAATDELDRAGADGPPHDDARSGSR